MRLAFATAVTAGTALLLTACGVPGSTPEAPDLPTEPPVSVPAPTDISSPNSPPPSTAPSATPSAASTPTPGEQPVATRPGSIAETRVTVQMYPVRRSGSTASANLYIASQNPDDPFTLFDSLGDGNKETSSKSEWGSVDGVRLLDTTAKKAYLPAVTADGSCVCSPDDDNTSYARSSVWVTVAFAAPPATVTTVSVSVPSFGTFPNVPVV